MFIEVSAHPVLAMPLTAACAGVQGAVVGSLRRDAGGLATLHRNLGVLHTQGYAVSWATLLAEVAGPVVALPTYAFQRQRYWLEPARSLADVAAAGLSPSPHPLLGAATTLADMTACCSRRGFRWPTIPGSPTTRCSARCWCRARRLLELALAAGRRSAVTRSAKLTLAAPLVLPPQGAVRLQVRCEAADGTGARAFALYGRMTLRPMKRRGPVMPRARWFARARSRCRGQRAPCLMSGLLRAPCLSTSRSSIRSWRRRGSAMALRSKGSPRRGETNAALYGRAVLPERIAATAGDYGIHPALLDAALHLLAREPAFGNEEARARRGAASVRVVGCGAAGNRRLELRSASSCLELAMAQSAAAAMESVRRDGSAGGDGRAASL